MYSRSTVCRLLSARLCPSAADEYQGAIIGFHRGRHNSPEIAHDQNLFQVAVHYCHCNCRCHCHAVLQRGPDMPSRGEIQDTTWSCQVSRLLTQVYAIHHSRTTTGVLTLVPRTMYASQQVHNCTKLPGGLILSLYLRTMEQISMTREHMTVPTVGAPCVHHIQKIHHQIP